MSRGLSIAAVVPCHNYGRFLAECLESLLQQSLPLLQIVVVLDGCSDDSAEVAARYRHRGVETITANVRQIYLARRLGLRQVEADLVFFLDADDRVAPDYAEKAAAIFEANPRVGIVTGVCRSFGESFGEWLPDVTQSIETENRASSAAVVRCSALGTTRAFDQLAGARRQDEDWFVWKHLVREGWKLARSESIHEHRRHRNNYSLAYSYPWAEEVRRRQRYQPPRRLRVAWLTPTLCTGGVTANTYQKMRWSRTVTWSRAVLLDKGPSDLAGCQAIEAHAVPIVAGVPHTSANTRIADRRESSREAAIEAAREADVVYSWGHLNGDLIREIAEFCPVIFGLHGEADWTIRAAAAVAPWVTRFYAVSRAAARVVAPEHRGKTVVIENGVDLELLAPVRGRDAVRDSWGFKPNDRAIGFIGRISPEKRPEALLDALEGLPANFRPVYVTPQAEDAAVVWNAQQRDAIRERVIARGGVWTSAPLTGMGDVYAALDCLVIPSQDEGGPLVMLEAFAAGTPVVSTLVGLLPSLERRHGPLAAVVMQPATPEDLRAAIAEALSWSFEERCRRAKDVVWRHGTASRMAAEFEALCWAVCSA